MRVGKTKRSFCLFLMFYREIKDTDKTSLTKQSFRDDHPFFEIGKEREKKTKQKKERAHASSLISSRRRQDVVSIYDPPKSRPPCQTPRVSLFCLSAHFCTFKTFFAVANFIIRARVRTSRSRSSRDKKRSRVGRRGLCRAVWNIAGSQPYSPLHAPSARLYRDLISDATL